MRTRRALSTVVGMAFAIIALSSTFAYISYSMNTLSTYNQSVVQKNQQLVDVGKEKFQITSVTFVNNKFSITVANTGNLPINFTKLWIQNMSNTDWYKSYVPTSNIVGPGGTVTLGQSFKNTASMSIDSTKSYNIKLTTSRGNTQQFTVNSASAAPLNIQLLALPASVASGFKTELVMIVTNNGSSVLANITPSALPAPTLTGGASCAAGSVSPANYNTLSPGGTAIFKWDITITGTITGGTCTYTITTPLQNGYAQTVQATITLTQVAFTSTNLAQNTGILTINYTTFRYSQGNTWNTGWSFPASGNTVYSVQITNNNATGDFYMSANTQFYFSRTGGANNKQVFLVNATTLSPLGVTKYTCTLPTNDYCQKIPSGQTVTVYFGASTKQGNTLVNLGQADTYLSMMLVYGKFSSAYNVVGTTYAQTIPYLAIQGT